jgi:hypothetical protein
MTQKILKSVAILIVCWCVGFVGALVVSDAVGYFCQSRSTYKTPWYDARWHKQPVTHIFLSSRESTIYWTSNVCGQPWKVKETKVGDKVFWTVIEKR